MEGSDSELKIAIKCFNQATVENITIDRISCKVECPTAEHLLINVL